MSRTFLTAIIGLLFFLFLFLGMLSLYFKSRKRKRDVKGSIKSPTNAEKIRSAKTALKTNIESSVHTFQISRETINPVLTSSDQSVRRSAVRITSGGTTGDLKSGEEIAVLSKKPERIEVLNPLYDQNDYARTYYSNRNDKKQLF